MYRIRSYHLSGQPVDINAWVKRADGTIFETADPTTAQALADVYNLEQKGRKGSKRLRYEVVDFDKRRGVPKLGRGQN